MERGEDVKYSSGEESGCVVRVSDSDEGALAIDGCGCTVLAVG